MDIWRFNDICIEHMYEEILEGKINSGMETIAWRMPHVGEIGIMNAKIPHHLNLNTLAHLLSAYLMTFCVCS